MLGSLSPSSLSGNIAIVIFGVNALDSKRIPYRDIHIPQLLFIHNINSKMAVALFAEMLEGLPTDDSAQTQKPVSYKSSV
jgi:hypothetical protein